MINYSMLKIKVINILLRSNRNRSKSREKKKILKQKKKIMKLRLKILRKLWNKCKKIMIELHQIKKHQKIHIVKKEKMLLQEKLMSIRKGKINIKIFIDKKDNQNSPIKKKQNTFINNIKQNLINSKEKNIESATKKNNSKQKIKFSNKKWEQKKKNPLMIAILNIKLN